MDLAALSACAFERWQPGIGDPTLVGWLTVWVYALAAVLALAVAGLRSGGRGRGRKAERLFWAGSAVFLCALAINKQLDLQSLLTAVGRCTAMMQGWYAERRLVQRDVILALIAASGISGLFLAVSLRRTLRRTGLALLGLAAVTGFVLVRAVGFHHFDELIGVRVSGLRLNWVFELGALGVFILGALLGLRRRP